MLNTTISTEHLQLSLATLEDLMVLKKFMQKLLYAIPLTLAIKLHLQKSSCVREHYLQII